MLADRGPLSRADWVLAGLQALARGGPNAVRVEAIARGIRVSKGSFYWHFKDAAELKFMMREVWRIDAGEGVIRRVEEASGSAYERLQTWAGLAGNAAIVGDFHGLKLEPAVREWARYDHAVADMLRGVDEKRLRYLSQLFAQAGNTDNPYENASIFYAAGIGLDPLSESGLADVAMPLYALLDALLSASRPLGRAPAMRGA
ncbi:TetR/AcrR family transcriptional regulator [Rhizobiales bacterium]|uniref:TetR/AcrR family transcriptional regulator n=1 Tax=Hongsoonwoonella zoysiae TaxID=2821844 RepID=UPI00155F9678|nr:TetR/AcrR family transcriptional regulator [Hongsoonwoonella zoysiae]NRG19773.1 TetR/AcrR family transcriptional regulator [Hongsoonwoonella zoysiae]